MKNEKGFLLAEALIVSTFVLTILIVLFIQFSNLTNNYKASYNHNNVESIYDLSSVSNYLTTNEYDLYSQLSVEKPYVLVYSNNRCNIEAGITDTFCDDFMKNMGAKTIIYTYSDVKPIQYYVNNNEDENIKQRFREFISKIDAKEVQNKGRLFAEFENGTFATIAFNTNSYDIADSTLECTPENVVTKGDGLYQDEEGKCVFKGKNPNNYIRFNNELWRIISLEKDGTIKIMRNESTSTQAFDDANSRNENAGTYCENSVNGCNAWATSDNFTNGSISGNVLRDSILNSYLNSTYLNQIRENKINITTHSWNVGPITANNDNFTNQKNDEAKIKWSGKIGLISVSEYLNANSNINQCGTLSLNNNNTNSCIKTNWIYDIAPVDGNTWTITPNFDNNYSVFVIQKLETPGNVHFINASNTESYVVPALYLSENTLITGGNGTKENPFIIDEASARIELIEPTFKEEGEGPKNVTINFQEECKDMLLCTYQIDDGEIIRVKDTEVELEFEDDADISASVSDGAQTVTNTYRVEIIDVSLELALSTTVTSNSITVVANAKTEFPVNEYEFSIDGGKTWRNNGTNNVYTFTNLTQGTHYSIVVRATNTAGTEAKETTEATTTSLQKPTFSESGINPKNVTITFPKECETTLTCTYRKNNGSAQTVIATTATVPFTDSGSLSASVSDGYNEVNSTYTVKIGRTVTYNYSQNGGTSATKTNATVEEDDAIDLTPTATKEGWTFVGWNTNSNATEGLTSLNMGSSNVTLYAIYRKEARTITVTFNKNNSISQTPSGGSANTDNTLTQTCTIAAVYNNATQATSCNVISPKITAPSNTPTVVGYNTSASATTSSWNQNTTKSISEDTTYYAITRKDTKTLTAIFNANGANLSSTSNKTCTLDATYNGEAQETSCTVTAPTITRIGFTIIGFNTSASATSNNSNYNATNNTITLTSSNDSLTWYALTSKEVTVTFTEGSYVSSIGAKSRTCTIRNSSTTCPVSLPSITPSTNYVALGWYNGNSKVGDAGDTYYAGNDITLTAKGGNETVTLSISTTSTTNSITVVASAYAASGITKYEYSKNGGSTWTNGGTRNTYTFTDLTQATSYNIRVRVTAASGKQATASKTATTLSLARPTFSESNEGEVKISYPSGCSGGKTCSYTVDNGSSKTTTGTTTVYVGEDGTIVAKVTDGTNTVTSSYTVVRTGLYVSSSGSDITGYGTINKPYATINKAYSSATTSSTRTSTIYVMSTLTQSSTVSMNSNKKIILTSYGSTRTVNRGRSLRNNIIKQTNGELTLRSITIDGNNVSATSPMIYVGKKVTMESGATLRDAVTTADYGGAVSVYNSGRFIMNSGSTITNNDSTNGNRGGAGVYVFDYGSFTMNGGTISNNESYNGAGVWNHGTFNMYGGSITGNRATHYNAGVDTPGTFNLRGGRITNNSAPIGGGVGVTVYNGSRGRINVYGGTVNNNTATSSSSQETDNINIVETASAYASSSGLTYTQGTLNYIVSAKATGSGLAAEGEGTTNNTAIVLWQNSGNNQKWRTYLLKVVNGTAQYGFAVYHTPNKWLWIQNNSTNAGANVILYSMNQNNGGYWTLKSAGSGYYYFKNVGGLCLDLYNNETANGTKIDAYTCNNANNQKWKFTATS